MHLGLSPRITQVNCAAKILESFDDDNVENDMIFFKFTFEGWLETLWNNHISILWGKIEKGVP